MTASRRPPGGLADLRGALRAAASGRRGLVVGLDFDGTLSPLVARPHQARLPAATRRLLRRLAASPRVTVAFISGRSVGDVRRRVGLEGAFYSGNHGLEILGPRLRWRHASARSAAGGLARLARALAGPLRDAPGAWLEDKGLTLSVHTRGVSAGRARALGKAVRRSAAPFLGRFVLGEGKKTIEFRPHARWDKGHALLRIARTAAPGGRLLFMGDDRTDEDGFRTLAHRAMTVRVGGRGKTHARFRVARQSQVPGVLKLIAEEFL